MSYPKEKSYKNVIIGDSGGNPVGLDAPPPVPVYYTESKRTWRSYFWSSEIPHCYLVVRNNVVYEC